MKTWYLCLVLIFAVCSTGIVQAAVAIKAPTADVVASEQGQTVSELPVEQVEQAAKLRLRERVAQRMVQRKIEKAQREGGTSDSNTLGLLSLIFGILGLLLIFFPIIGFLGLLFGIAAFVLGIMGIKRNSGTGMAIAGLVLGGVVVLLLFLGLVFLAILF